MRSSEIVRARLGVAAEDVEILVGLVAGRREVGLHDLDVVELDERASPCR